MDILITVLEIIGTVAFAISGAMTAFQKNMDLLGVLLLGFTTALGGGVIRDIMLGNTPPNAFLNPTYAFVALATSFIMFLPFFGKLFKKFNSLAQKVLLVMDAVGLGIFTVLGVQTTYLAQGGNISVFSLVFFGVLTGVGGGVLRDVLAGNSPYIFTKHFYATAAILGALVCAVMLKITEPYLALLTGTVIIIVLRICAAHFRWKLPKHKE